MPLSELTRASLGEINDLNDRERLALAFGILRESGWFAPIEWSTSLCCTPHGWAQVGEHFSITADEWAELPYEDEPPTIWWNVQTDTLAFLGTLAEMPMSEVMEKRIDAVYDSFQNDATVSDPEAALAAWMDEHEGEIISDETVQRTTVLVDLVDGLRLHWSGGTARMLEAVEVLRSVGLHVSEATNPSQTIMIHPRHTPMQAAVRVSDGRLALWFNSAAFSLDNTPTAVLSREDAEALIDMVRVALAASLE